MATFVLNHFEVPAGGSFYYVQPETKARIEAGTYESWMDAIEKHRIGNKLELEPMWKLHVEEWLCYDLKTRGIDWCRVNGVGDIIAFGLRPLVHLADQYLGTNLANCRGCHNRQKQMNR